MVNHYRILSLFCFAGILSAVAVIADEPAAQKSLEQFNSLIGEWRGIGQPRRGSNAGAWKQTGKWVWDFSNDEVALQYEVTDGQLEQTGRLTFDPETSLYLLDMTTPDGQVRKYQGDLVDDKLTLESSSDPEGTAHRITLTLLNENRTLVLHEQKEASQQRFFRVAEIGYTRAGVRLAKPGGGQPECIVTGGAGTIEVTYKGKTYYVCCSGCKQAFEDDPEGIIAEAAKRRKEQQSKDN